MSSTTASSNGQPHQCLPAQQLKAYLQGELAPAQIEQVAAQTESCQACQQTMERIEAEHDELLSAVRAGNSEPPWEDSDELADLLAAAELVQAESHSQAGDAADDLRDPPAESQQVGQYLLREPLGHGGMGTVWRAAVARSIAT